MEINSVVVDTNVLVSAFWSHNKRAPSQILGLLLERRLKAVYCWEILQEYETVLLRPEFKFKPAQVHSLLNFIETEGISVIPAFVETPFTDEADRKFYAVAKAACSILITGNKRHFPDDGPVLSPAEFIDLYADAALNNA
ncbi:MAG: putative toxin-antitoxin system toxin component, PIN family [Synergistaceae bacterium]|nr:putative toxin-antitoxin system toxin component, PIN family [Synergistaceae bacterium]